MGLEVHEDPLTAPISDPAHAVVDFRRCNDKDARAKSQLLKSMAEPIYVQRGDDPP